MRFESAGQLSDHIDHLTCTLARAFNEGRLHADQYARLFAVRTEAHELVIRAAHFRDTGDRRALAAEHEARAAVAVLVLAMEGIR